MTALVTSPFIVDSVWQRTKSSAFIQISALTTLTIFSAQIIIPLPFTPVPLTMQTFAILLGASTLGPIKSLIAQFAYVLIAALGAPVLAGNRGGLDAVLGATGGYLVGFIVASFVVGTLAHRVSTKKFQGVFFSYFVGSFVIYTFGATWLSLYTGKGISFAIANGVLPFLIGDFLKASLAATLLPTTWRLINK
jgi:biotin transport system substrate-specific component